jgi:hypothetical protein
MLDEMTKQRIIFLIVATEARYLLKPTFSVAKDAPTIFDAARTEGRSRHGAVGRRVHDPNEEVGPVDRRHPVPVAADVAGRVDSAVLQVVAKHPVEAFKKKKLLAKANMRMLNFMDTPNTTESHKLRNKY